MCNSAPELAPNILFSLLTWLKSRSTSFSKINWIRPMLTVSGVNTLIQLETPPAPPVLPSWILFLIQYWSLICITKNQYFGFLLRVARNYFLILLFPYIYTIFLSWIMRDSYVETFLDNDKKSYLQMNFN